MPKFTLENKVKTVYTWALHLWMLGSIWQMDFYCRLVHFIFQWLWKHVRTKIIKQQHNLTKRKTKLPSLSSPPPYLSKSKRKKMSVTEILQHHGQYPQAALHDPAAIFPFCHMPIMFYTVWVSAEEVLNWLILWIMLITLTLKTRNGWYHEKSGAVMKKKDICFYLNTI